MEIKEIIEGSNRGKLRRMRTINQAIEEIKEMDSNSAITYNFINTLIKNNVIRYINIGNKRLIDLNSFLDYLEG